MSNLSKNDRYLIINADDFGMCHSANMAIVQMFKDKVITSSSIMPVCPWYEEASQYAQEYQYDLGIHLTFTNEWQHYKWQPLSCNESLQDSNGYSPRTCLDFERKANKADVIQEIQLQVNKIQNSKLDITHIDNHMGSLYGLNAGKSYLPEILDICSLNNLPFRFPKVFSDERKEQISDDILDACKQIIVLAQHKNVTLIDHLIEYPFHQLAGEDYSSFKNMIISKLRNLKLGVSELYIHPAVESNEIKHINPSWLKRVMEYRVFYENDVQNVISQEGIKLIPWAELSK